MRLTVIGCGYVGLVTGACLAAAGHEVFCTDIDENRIDQLKAGKVPIYEEHLDEVLQRAVREKKISYTSDAGEAPSFVSGVLQLNVVVPTNITAGDQPIVVTIGGNPSQQAVTVSVK